MSKRSTRDLRLLGVALYACEGTKLRIDKRSGKPYYAIEFTNSDPKLIKLFLEFLRKIIGIEESKLKGLLLVYDDAKKRRAEKYWSDYLNIPLSQFNKTVIHPSRGRNNLSPTGTFKIRYYSKTKRMLLETMVKEFLK